MLKHFSLNAAWLPPSIHPIIFQSKWSNFDPRVISSFHCLEIKPALGPIQLQFNFHPSLQIREINEKYNSAIILLC